MMSIRKQLVLNLISLYIGAGAGFFLIALVKPMLFIEYPWLTTFVYIWLALLAGGFLYLIYRLTMSDEKSASRRKSKANKDWRSVEATKDAGVRRREAGYSREAIMRASQAEQAKDKQEAREREGVKAVFGPDREAP